MYPKKNDFGQQGVYMAEKYSIVELIQVKKNRSLWLRPDCILFFEKKKTPTSDEIVLHLTNGLIFYVLDNDANRKKLQGLFNLIV